MTPDGLPDSQVFRDGEKRGLVADWESESARLPGVLWSAEILSDRRTILLRFKSLARPEGFEIVATMHLPPLIEKR